MFKMGSHNPFGNLKHKLGPKKGPRIKLTIWLSTTKSRESPRFPCVKVACDISLESFDESYNFASNLISIGGPHTKLWAPKVTRILIVRILGLPLGSPETKWHLGVGLVASHKVYYEGKVVASPKSGPWWVLWVRVCSWLILAPKVLQLCSN
jgi:hypothetical protein